jgi:hypothetical protein
METITDLQESSRETDEKAIEERNKYGALFLLSLFFCGVLAFFGIIALIVAIVNCVFNLITK